MSLKAPRRSPHSEQIFAAALLAVSSLLLPSVPVEAHTASTFYDYTWVRNTTEHWVIDNDVPTGDFRDSIKFGVGQWDNGAGGGGPNYVFDEEVNSTNDFNPCTGTERSIVFIKEDLASALGLPSESVLGYANFCLEGPRSARSIGKFDITLEKTATGADSVGWYTGSGTPPSNRHDLRSVATHETGHTTGWVGHFTGDSLCDPKDMPAYQTMCQYVPPLGTTGWRQLETHDLHTYGDAY
jgi:hypothetical protein